MGHLYQDLSYSVYQLNLFPDHWLLHGTEASQGRDRALATGAVLHDEAAFEENSGPTVEAQASMLAVEEAGSAEFFLALKAGRSLDGFQLLKSGGDGYGIRFVAVESRLTRQNFVEPVLFTERLQSDYAFLHIASSF